MVGAPIVDGSVGTLLIYLAEHCYGCETAHRMAGLVPLRRPQWQVVVVDVATAGDALPAYVIGTPIYAVDGQVISLGNPSESDLLATLDSLSEKGSVGHGLKPTT
jgi:hypothetical protein